jgi:hypothetical protein
MEGSYEYIGINTMLSGSLSPWQGTSSGCGWRRQPPDMEGSCECIGINTMLSGPCHHGGVCPQGVDGGNSLQIRMVAVNIIGINTMLSVSLSAWHGMSSCCGWTVAVNILVLIPC